jgi:hypothetical protein
MKDNELNCNVNISIYIMFNKANITINKKLKQYVEI